MTAAEVLTKRQKLTAVPADPPRAVVPLQPTWDAMLAALRAVYRAEVERLTTELRSRILAGEWSGTDDEGRGGPAYCRLEWEIVSTHPWAAKEGEEGPAARLVLACSTWAERYGRMLEAGDVGGLPVIAGECLAHDVLAEAAARGWVAPLRTLDTTEPYRLRVAK